VVYGGVVSTRVQIDTKAEMSSEVQDIPTPPFDGTPGGLISWLLGILCAIIAFLWKLNEGKNGAAIVDIQRRLTESETLHELCREDRHKQGCELATFRDRLIRIERQSTHEAGK
jgi:hypothetical protein